MSCSKWFVKIKTVAWMVENLTAPAFKLNFKKVLSRSDCYICAAIKSKVEFFK